MEQEKRLIANRYQMKEHMRYVGETDYYAAVDVSSQQAVTLRIIDTSQIGRVGIGLEHLAVDKLRRKMENEAKLIDKLKHPGLLTLLDYGFDDPCYYHVYPPFKFKNLKMHIDQQGQIPLADMLNYTSQAAQTLAALHDMDIVHCDVSAETLLLIDGQVKLIEFAIANYDAPEGSAPGEPPYMSPESISGARPAPARDIWALGVVLYYGLAGKLPFGNVGEPRADSVPQLFQAIMTQNPEPIADMPPQVNTLISHLLEKDPAKRPATMQAVQAGIMALL